MISKTAQKCCTSTDRRWRPPYRNFARLDLEKFLNKFLEGYQRICRTRELYHFQKDSWMSFLDQVLRNDILATSKFLRHLTYLRFSDFSSNVYVKYLKRKIHFSSDISSIQFFNVTSTFKCLKLRLLFCKAWIGSEPSVA